MNIKSKSNYIPMLIYILSAAFFFWLASQIPYTHDDWDWGLDNGIRQFVTASINSRYAGNFLEVIMTRSHALKTLIMGTTFTLIPLSIAFILSRLLGGFKKQIQPIVFLMSVILLLTMNLNVFQQTYGWIAGFSNFVISVLPLSIFI